MNKATKSTSLFFIVLIITFISLHRAGCTVIDLRPEETSKNTTAIDPTIPPLQEDLSLDENKTITKKIKGKPALLHLKARYKIAGRVITWNHYYKTWQSLLSPVDLGLAWGLLATTQYDQYLNFRASTRYYVYRFSHDFPLDQKDIVINSSNNHLIAANKYIEKVLKSIRNGEVIEIEGHLVDVEGNGGELEKIKLITSLTRTDEGYGACEVIYVTKVKIADKVYDSFL